MLILTERTPNPAALKFIPPTSLVDGDGWAFARENFDAAQSPLVTRLFAIDGVSRVFIAPGFLTVTHAPDAGGWTDLKHLVLAALAEHLESGEAAVTATARPHPSDELADEIRQVLSRHVRPGVARDGGDILFDRFDATSGVLWIRMQGACGGCPSARSTLKSGVEAIVRRYVPEVLRVEEAAGEAAPEAAVSRFSRWLQAPAGSGRRGTTFTHSGRPFRG